VPHCILEHSSNIVETPDWRDLLRKINRTLADTGLFKSEDIKSRAVCHNISVVGDGDPSRAFVTLNVCILSGRDDTTKRRIAEPLAALLVSAFPRSAEQLKFSVSVQVTDIHRESYQRKTNY
jgi:5-carboxymethyl-2-hydroxymuconate isomerase